MDRVSDLTLERLATPLGDLTLERLATPLGEMLVAADGAAVRAIEFSDCADRLARNLRVSWPRLSELLAPARGGLAERLGAYFAGELRAIDGIVVGALGTPFQRKIWAALRTLPPGESITYGQLAADLGMPRASRAVGAANGANPVSIVVPCHRLTGADGTLTGYAGGLARKAWLLRHEAGLSPRALPGRP